MTRRVAGDSGQGQHGAVASTGRGSMAHRVDTHCHVWDRARWRPAILSRGATDIIRRSFGLDEWRRSASECGIDRCVIVQAVRDTRETRELLFLAADVEAVIAVVGWVDLEAPVVGSTLASLQSGEGGGKLVGVRLPLHLQRDAKWLSEPGVRRGLDALLGRQLQLELTLSPAHWHAALQIFSAFPAAPVVLDHMGGVPTTDEEWRAWNLFMSEASLHENVWCKISGQASWASANGHSGGVFAAAVKRCVELFRWDRLLWGSDWPVCLLEGSYSAIYHETASILGDGRWLAVLSENAEHWYSSSRGGGVIPAVTYAPW